MFYKKIKNILSKALITKYMGPNKPFKLKYFNCLKGNDHEGEYLNLVCIDKECKKRGVICSICKSQSHATHNVLPLKMLLEQLQDHHERPMNTQNFQDHLGSIESLRNQLLYELRVSVEEVAEKFRQLQQIILDNFGRIKVELLEQLNMKFESIITNAIGSRLQNQEEFSEDMIRIANLINYNEANKHINFQIDLSRIVKEYEESRKELSSILGNVKDKIFQILQKNKVEERLMKKVKIDHGKESHSSAKQGKLVYTFSSVYKGASIVLQNNNKLARQSDSLPTRLVLVQEGLGVNKQSITFKIQKLKNWIGVGIGIRDVLLKNNYNFNYNNLGHGSYLVSSNGFTWSHSEKQDNIISKDFNFIEGDIIDVKLKYNNVTFKRRKDNKTLKLKISLKPEEWTNICFCANLCTKDDSIMIID